MIKINKLKEDKNLLIIIEENILIFKYKIKEYVFKIFDIMKK
jgi:hypothetical protein